MCFLIYINQLFVDIDNVLNILKRDSEILARCICYDSDLLHFSIIFIINKHFNYIS